MKQAAFIRNFFTKLLFIKQNILLGFSLDFLDLDMLALFIRFVIPIKFIVIKNILKDAQVSFDFGFLLILQKV